ncbi:MAG: carboxylating nicotinate-nucleotide diphosphorylase, partial [Desulfotomaculales bacterium]
GERAALNFLQRLCGVATFTRRLVQMLDGHPARLVDTRKTTPGLRLLEKYAVRAGGGGNHRFGLYDAVLIKDNHLKVAGSIARAVQLARASVPLTMKIEVETENLAQVEEALAAGADIIMLDNMDPEEMKRAVDLVAGRALLEASGGISEKNILAVARTGVDFISAGALTHSAPALDISLEII